MVERPLGPRDRIVTILANDAERGLMVVVVAMAIYADDRGIRVALGGMTLIAFCRAVLPEERKSRQVVIEGDIDVPSAIVVALLAVDAQLPLMNVVRLVA
jgi:hypothetical protein